MNFEPNWASPPGDTIARLMAASNISSHELAGRLGFEESEFAGLMDGSTQISTYLADTLSQELGSSPQFWVNRYNQFVADTQRLVESKPTHDLDTWGAQFQVKPLRDIGWLPRRNRGRQLSTDILEFFGCKSIEQWNTQYSTGIGQVAFRTSFAFEANELATLAWLHTGELALNDIDLPKFSNTRFRKLLPHLKALCAYKHPKVFLPKLQEECARAGVGVVSSRAPSGCRASGASWINKQGNPTILLSFRHLSEDHFWFTFFHEAAHVILHGTDHIDFDGTDPSPFGISNQENEADQFAQNVLISDDLNDELLNAAPSPAHARRMARLAGVTPGIVVGQLQKFGVIQPHQFNYLKRRYRWNDDFTIPDVVQPRKYSN